MRHDNMKYGTRQIEMCLNSRRRRGGNFETIFLSFDLCIDDLEPAQPQVSAKIHEEVTSFVVFLQTLWKLN
jgi:hypothetical protein